MELTTSWKEEGRQEGREEGRHEGQVEMALRLLRRRCGPLPKRLDSKVGALTIPELEDLAEAVLDFSSLADFEGWLVRH
jgi:predicted transposase YdaD